MSKKNRNDADKLLKVLAYISFTLRIIASIKDLLD